MTTITTIPTARAFYPFYSLSTATPEFLAAATMPEIADWFALGAGFASGRVLPRSLAAMPEWQKTMALLALIDHGNPNADLLTSLAFDCLSPEEAFDAIARGEYSSCSSTEAAA